MAKGVVKALALAVAVTTAGGVWYVNSKLPIRSGQLALSGLSEPVAVRYDERGVPHIKAANQLDAYRALGYVQAQDRLFQMEMLRRLAKGQLAEILGPQLIETDRLFRTLRLDQRAQRYLQESAHDTPQWQALQAYIDGINAFQDSHAKPLEFDLLGISPRPFSPEDVFVAAGYTAYSFAAALRTEPLLTQIRDQLGSDYLNIFDLKWHPQGVTETPLAAGDWQDLSVLTQLSTEAISRAGLPQLEGSNAWAVSGSRTASGKPLLAGDPHISFAVPAVWYEAQITTPDFNLYGHFQTLNPAALLGFNQDFAWSLTMFQNDDMDLVAEKVNPDNPNQVWYQGQWVDMTQQRSLIKVKGAPDVELVLRDSPHGPIINDALGHKAGKTPIALWWAFLQKDNAIYDAFYQLNRADTLEKARNAASLIGGPGLNVVWANKAGDIGWWAAAHLPIRPQGVNPSFILNGANGEADKLGFYPFSANPQEENPERGYIVSANQQPVAASGIEIPGYYNMPARAQRLNQQLQDASIAWDTHNSQALQLDSGSAYGPRVLAPILDELRQAAQGDEEQQLVKQLSQWDGDHSLDSVAATLFNQLVYQLLREATVDELGEQGFIDLIASRAIDEGLPRLTADAHSPWWQDKTSSQPLRRADIVARAWSKTLAHLRQVLDQDSSQWQWRRAHTLTQVHPLGMKKPLERIFNVGPFAAPGGHETPNNLSHKIGPAPWKVVYGPSTRRLIDLAEPERALGINPVGQSGVRFDAHYADQAEPYIKGQYQPMHLNPTDVQAHSAKELILNP